MASSGGTMLGRIGQGLAITLLVAAAVLIALRILELSFHLAPGSPPIEAFEVAGVLLVGYTLSHRITAAIKVWASQNNRLSQLLVFGLLLDLLVAGGVVLALFAVFNVSPTNLLYGGALTGVVLALASQSLLANAFSGLVLAIAAPFQIGDTVSVISASYGALAPSYSHEMLYPSYTGRVEHIGLFYTRMRLANGRDANLPNSVVIQALVVNLKPTEPHLVRVRLTLPHTLAFAEFASAVAHPATPYPPSPPGHPDPEARLADIGTTGWDGLVVLWTTEADEDRVRDQILQSVLPKLSLAPSGTGGAVAPAGSPASGSVVAPTPPKDALAPAPPASR